MLKRIRAVEGPDGDVEVVRRPRSWFALDSFSHLVTGNVLALLAAEGPRPMQKLAQVAHEQLGQGWASADGRPIQVSDVVTMLRRQRHQLVGLDLIEPVPTRGDEIWACGPRSLSALPRATALADIWAHGGTDNP